MSNTVNISQDLSPEQSAAIPIIKSNENVFVTGGAGCGKSFLIQKCRTFLDHEKYPILASTGAAAVLIGGRTFHSFFGLGIMEGGIGKTFERAIIQGRLKKRLNSIEGFIVDEISMISGEAFTAAEMIARELRNSSKPWGGLRIIAVGDFAQLPPISKHPYKDWCFLTPTWQNSEFKNVVLTINHRVNNNQFLKILNQVRTGTLDDSVIDFLESKTQAYDIEESGLCLYSLRNKVDTKNSVEIQKINEEMVSIPSIYIGDQKHVEMLMKVAPIPKELNFKIGCKVLFVKNDPQNRWINGTRGTIKSIAVDKITVKKDSGRDVTVEKFQFGLQDADGNTVASVINFPLILAYAMTIHRSQGSTLEKAWVDLSRLWEPGHAYVALSRFRNAEDIALLGWHPSSFKTDPIVTEFYSKLETLPKIPEFESQNID